jgi:hypothetical protein
VSKQHISRIMIYVVVATRSYIRSQSGYDAALRSIEGLAGREAAAGRTVPPLYFLLIRPVMPHTLVSRLELIEVGRNYELYAIDKP